MIYFLDNSLQLQKIVTSKNVISAIHEHELNGLIRADVELDLSYANKFLVLGIDHVGYYYKDEFYLHKIQRVEYDHVNESAKVVLRHIFFEDMIFGKLIQDVRPQNQDALTVSRQTIDANTRWQTIMTDVTGRLSTNFYWQVPYEVIEFMTENYRIEYLPKILFDGQKINSFQLHLANKIGEDKNIRIPYGSRILDLKYEEDYSEIITKLVVHGKGEEVGDGYGRRINISDVNFSRNGVKSPVGSLYLEDESITNTYGNDGQTPREGREVFEDIEDTNELAEAGYQHYLQVSRPQMLFTADVADIGDVGIGDSVMIIRREYDVYFKARIHKLSVDLLYPEDAQVELGDYKHFKESKIARKTREKNNRVQGQLSDRITRLKQEADERFDNEVGQWFEEYEQALIDVYAEIEADRENMTNLIEGTRTEFTDNLNTEITQTKEYAEQQAQAKSEAVRTDLEMVTNGHQTLIDGLKENVMDIDEFLGTSRSITLDQRFLDISHNFEERLRKVDSNTFNMIRGTRFDEPDMFSLRSGAELQEEGNIKFVTLYSERFNEPRVQFTEGVTLEKGKKYMVAVDYRSYGAKELDRLAIGDLDGYYNLIDDVDKPLSDLHTDGKWRRTYRTVIPSETVSGEFQIGTNFASGDVTRERIDIKLVYLTGSNNTDWVYHPQDATQSIEEVTRRITNLEDGYSEFVTKSLYDEETDTLNQYIKSVEQTVEGNELILQRVEDWQATNGQSVLETVDAYERKLWLNDVANIGANLIPQSANAWEDGGLYISGNPDNVNTGNIRMVKSIPILEGETYTLSDDSDYYSRLNNIRLHVYKDGKSMLHRNPTRQSTITFIANGDELRISLHPPGLPDWTYINTSQMEDLENPIRIKLERGSKATPMLNAISRVEQLADRFAVQVSELDGEYLRQSSIEIEPGYWQLGSVRIGGDAVGSVLRGSPDALDAVVSEFNLSGNFNAKGQITSLAVDAIEGNFARLFANQLTTNVITSDHIQVGTALIDKLFATSARIDRLITKTHFVNEMHALTLNVVDLNASQIRTRLLSANTIEAEWLKGGTALLDKVFASTAMFERMMAKSAFITTLSTVTLDLHELTIWRPDGVAYIQNGVPSFGIPVFFKPWMPADGAVTFDGRNYNTSMSGSQTFEMGYTQHAGRYLSIAFSANLRYSSASTSTYMGVVVRFINKPSGTSIRDVIKDDILVFRDNPSNEFQIDVPLGRPTYGGLAVQLEFYRIGGTSNNTVQIRTGRAWING